MGEFSEEEVNAAFDEYRLHGVINHDWEAWGSLFTEEANYVEHFLGEFKGRQEITEWIVTTMMDYPNMSLWMEWWVVQDDKVALYIWNNLPDPTGTGKRYGFPNTTLLKYAGDGKWEYEEDFYNPADAQRVWGEWFNDGGRIETPIDRSLRGIDDWAPEVPQPPFPREEVEREFLLYTKRGELAVETGDWDQWADQFTDDARYFEHNYGKFSGREEIREWITGIMGPFPEMTFPVDHYLIEGNRVVAVIPNCLPDPEGGDTIYSFNVHVILHYAGGGKWSYEEDVYNPKEASRVISAWVEAGGEVP
ncbi:MAG: nuclear transport factor 2 family protein [Actinomycetota bacterium]|nr:nuclear transport factor 2 family protein [Actinomycetota bacterium]